MSEKKKPRTLEEAAKRITSLTKAFQDLIEWHDPTGRWRFTYSVSLSAEPIPQLERQIEKQKEEERGETV